MKEDYHIAENRQQLFSDYYIIYNPRIRDNGMRPARLRPLRSMIRANDKVTKLSSPIARSPYPMAGILLASTSHATLSI